MQLDSPIFVGGTGRSGTSVMAALLGSHPDLVLPAHENKLIVEQAGLGDLVSALSGPFELMRNHLAVKNFLLRATRLLKRGFAERGLDDELTRLVREEGMPYMAAFEQVQRSNPEAFSSLHAVGRGFGEKHFASCVRRFIGRVVEHVSDKGVVHPGGLAKPLYITRSFERSEILSEARNFLAELYVRPMVAKGAQRWLDDTPCNFVHSLFLKELYPQMKLIHMIRDPRDVISSYLEQAWAPTEPELAVALCANMINSYLAVRAAMPARQVFEVRLEDLVNQRERTIARLADFLDIEPKFDLGLLSAAHAHMGRSHKLDPSLIGFIEQRLGGWIREQGYHATPSLLQLDGA